MRVRLSLRMCAPVAESALWEKGSPYHPRRNAAGTECRPRTQTQTGAPDLHVQYACLLATGVNAVTVYVRWVTGVFTKSMVFFLFVSFKVCSTKVSQRPLQSSGSSATTQPHTHTHTDKTDTDKDIHTHTHRHIFHKLNGKDNNMTYLHDCRPEVFLWSPINPCNKTKNQTCDEAADLSMNRAFLQVVDHCVGDPGQVTHVPSPHPTRYPGNQEVEM